MTLPAKLLRLSRFRRRRAGAAGAKATGLLVPIDHGLTMGPLKGIRSIDQIATWITHPAISGIIAHKGMVERLAARDLLSGLGVMVHLNGMAAFSATPDVKELVTSVRSAQRLGADAVSIQVNFDGTNDAHNLKLLGRVADAALKEGVPVLTMLYDKVVHTSDRARLTRLRHLIRLTIELGTDAIKLAPPATSRLTTEVPELLADHARDTAIYFAGGATCPDAELLQLARETARCGGAGLCIGRNVFGRSDPDELLTTLDRSLSFPEPTPLRSAEGGGLATYFDSH